MSSTSSVASQPPVAYTPPVNNDRAQVAKAADDKDKAAEKAAAKVDQITATAVAAQSSKDARKGLVLDIRA